MYVTFPYSFLTEIFFKNEIYLEEKDINRKPA